MRSAEGVKSVGQAPCSKVFGPCGRQRTSTSPRTGREGIARREASAVCFTVTGSTAKRRVPQVLEQAEPLSVSPKPPKRKYGVVSKSGTHQIWAGGGGGGDLLWS